MSADSRMAEKRNELLEELVQLLVETLTLNNVSEAQATVAANDAADRLAQRWGGNMIYFPRDYQRELAKLELEILDQFDGRDYLAIARRHDMTESGVRRLINRVRAKLAARRHEQQLDLLEPPAEG